VFVNAPVSTTGLSVTVQKGGVLDLNNAAYTAANPAFPTLARLAGQGTLRIAAPYFPAITANANDFDDANTGTVEYYNWPAGATALPQPASNQYNNLRLLNTSATAYTAQLDNSLLTLKGSLTLVRTNTTVTTPLVSFNLGRTASNNRTLTVEGTITVGAGTSLGVTAVTGAHVLNVSGSFINNGTVNLHNGTTNDNQVALLNFTGNVDANFACNGPTDLGRLQVDKGIDSQTLLNVTSTVNPNNGTGNLHLNYVGDGRMLVLINGIAKFGNNVYLPKIHLGTVADNGVAGTGYYELGSSSNSPTLWVAGATILNNTALATIIYGQLRVSSGLFESLTPYSTVLREDAQVLIEGGTVNVQKFRPSSTTTGHRGSFTITGGLFDCRGTDPTSTGEAFSRFSIPYTTQSFRMTGGTIRVQNPEGTDGLFHIGVDPNNAIVTGGTIEVVLPGTNTNGKILTTAPLWNLSIRKSSSAGTSKAILSAITSPAGSTATIQPLTVLNNFVIDGTNPTTFDASAQNVNIQGSFTIGTLGTYLPSTNTTTFSGPQNQVLTNNGTIGVAATPNTFYNWVIDKAAGTLTLGGTATTYTVATAGTLSLFNGVLNDGGKTINVMGNMVNSASHTSGGGSGSITMAGSTLQTISGNDRGVFGNLTISSTMANTSPVVAVTMTANMSVSNKLNFATRHILAIGANRLSLTNVDPSTAITADNGFDNFSFVQTAGNQSDLGLQKTYGGRDNFVFPVGTGTKYAPATISLVIATDLAKYGQVSVSPVNAKNPFTTSTNALKYYWKVRSTGFGTIPTSAINMGFRLTSTDVVGTQANYIPARYNPVAWTPTNDPNLVGNGTPNANIAFNALNQFEGEFTAGEPSAFGTVTAFYSRTSGNWNTNTTWSTSSNSGAAVPTGSAAGVNFPGPGNPVFIGSASAGLFHTVSVTTGNATSSPTVAGATSGSLVIDRGSVLDIGTTTNHNFGALPDAKVGGSGRMRVSSNGSTANFFPGGDFGSFLQENGGTVEYYTTGTTNFTLPTASGTLSLNSYRNLWLNAGSGRTITLPNLALRVFAQLKTGVANGATTYPGLVLLSSAANGNLRADSLIAVQAGTFRYANGVARTLTADTDVRVDAGATFDVSTTGTAVTNALTVGGSVTNNGTLTLNAAGTSQTALTFTGSQNANLTGTNASASTTLYSLILNKGQGQAATLNLDVAGTLTTPTSNWLTLTNGTLRYAKGTGTLTIHNADSPYLIPDNAGLTIDAPGADVTVATTVTAPATGASAAADLKLAGQLKVLQGKLSVGTTSGLGNDLEYASAGAPTILVGAGGTLYVNGQIRRTTANTNGSLRYDQSGGSVEIGGRRAEVYQNNERGLLEVQGPGSIFRMTGGTLALRGTNTRPTIIADLYLRPDSTVVTAGTVVLGTTTSGNVTVSVESLVPLYDVKVEAGLNATSTNTGLLTGLNPLNLKGSLTIANDNAYFNANGLGLNIDQDLINNNTSTSTALNGGGFRPATATQTTTFTGKGPALQQLTGAAGNLTVFGGLVVNNAQANGTLRLGGNARVIGTLAIAKGTLADNGQTITALGDVNNSALHTSSGSGSLTLAGTTNQSIGGNGLGVFGNVVLSNAAGATTTANQEITSVLTLTNGVLNIGSNLLLLSNTAAGAVAGTFGSTTFIRTNGIVADQGVRKNYPTGASDFTFPIGAGSKYTPVRMNVTSNTAVGTLTVQPVDLAHPSTTDAAAKELSYYWKVRSTGFNVPVVTQVFSYVGTGTTNDVNGTESLYRLGRFLSGAWTPQGGVVASVVSTANHTLTNAATSFDGDYTGGEASEFGAVPTFYSRNATAGQTTGTPANWNDIASWTLNADGSDGPLAPPTDFPKLANPVVIRPGHIITANGNGRGAANLVLQGTLDLGANVANNFSTITGTGTLRIGSALFPAGNYSAFVAAGGGTVEYTGAVQLPARDTYNHLTLSGNNTKQLSNLDLTLNGALTIGTGTTVDNPTSQNINLTSNTSGATIRGRFNLNDGALTTGAFLNNSGTLVLGAGPVSVGTAFGNSGTLNNGSGAITVGTTFSNSGTYNANVGTGNLSVGTTFTNSSEYNAGVGKLAVGGNFSNTSSGTFTAASGDVTALGDFSNAGTYNGAGNIVRITGDFSNQGTGSFLADAANMVLRGNITNSGYFDPGTSLVQLLTEANRVITGNTTFYNLQKLGSSSLFFGTGTDVTVANLMTLQNGLISTGTVNKLVLTNTTTQPIIGTGLSSYVAGRLAMRLPNEAAVIRVFPVGAGSRYRPVTIKPQAAAATPVTLPLVLVEIFNGSPAGSIDATLSNLSGNRYYRIQLLEGTIVQPTVQLSFNTDVVDEQVNVPGNLRVAQSAGASGPWSTAGGGGVYSPEAPRGYTISAPTTINGNSFFALASTNKVDNPLTGTAPLPVTLLQFTAARQGSAVAVAWATATEKNSAYFQVERSADGHRFTAIGRVEAQGTSTSRHAYAALDAKPLAGLSYYRLRQVDLDGTVAYSPTVAVRFEGGQQAPGLVAYPNPATGQGFQLLASNLGSTGGTVTVFDNVGRAVLTQAVAADAVETTVQPKRPLAAGLYFVTWQTADGLKLTTKVTVE
jgi:hypothetical protein